MSASATRLLVSMCLVLVLTPAPAFALSGNINDGGVDVGDEFVVPGWPGTDGTDGSPGSSGSWLGPYLPGIPLPIMRAYCLAQVLPPAWCYSVLPTEPVEPEPEVPDVTLTDIAHVQPSSPTLSTEPAGWTVTHVETNLIARIATHVVETEVFNRPVEVRFTPTQFNWSFGDGSTRVTSVPGASWADLGVREFAPTATSHRYAIPEPVVPRVDVIYAVDYRWANGGWTRIEGSLSRGAEAPLVFVQTVDTVLVTTDCRLKPGAVGC